MEIIPEVNIKFFMCNIVEKFFYIDLVFVLPFILQCQFYNGYFIVQ